MKKLIKMYQLWYGPDGYSLREYDTLEELFDDLPNVYTNDFYITKKCNVTIEESHD
ncbi:MAG: hypothetical protein WC307_06645 [Candidatus Nanoarchaeia archaeon]|jgi:hypothetical protein